MSGLNKSEQETLAREVAADGFNARERYIKFECQECSMPDEVWGIPVEDVRDAVKHGWDAAMAYVKEHPGDEAEKWHKYAKGLECDIEAAEKHCAQYH